MPEPYVGAIALFRILEQVFDGLDQFEGCIIMIFLVGIGGTESILRARSRFGAKVVKLRPTTSI